jgi:hypothetical protein
MTTKRQRQKQAKAVIEQMAYNAMKAQVQSTVETCHKNNLSVQETNEIVKAMRSVVTISNHKLEESK